MDKPKRTHANQPAHAKALSGYEQVTFRSYYFMDKARSDQAFLARYLPRGGECP